MKIKPSYKTSLQIIVISSVLVASILFLSILIFDHNFNFSVAIIGGAFVMSLTTVALMPSILFESVSANNGILTYKELFSSKELPISEITAIYEGIGRRASTSLIFQSSSKSIQVYFKKYSKSDIQELIEYIHKSNPRIKLDFSSR